MGIVNPKSLAATVDVVDEVFFHGHRLSTAQKKEAAQWIASRQGHHRVGPQVFGDYLPDLEEQLDVRGLPQLRAGPITIQVKKTL